jgi:GxxExxY protein
MNDKIIHRELSYRLNGCIFDVHNEVGPGVREECYQDAMELRLVQADIPFVAKPATRGELIYRGRVADVFEPDLVVAELIIPELKHQPDGFCEDNFTQVLSYLKFRNLHLGLLVNFAMDKAIIERVPYDPPAAAVVDENYDYIRPLIRDADRPVLRAIREGLLEINRAIGLGYADKTYRNLTVIELEFRGLNCSAKVEVTPTFREKTLPRSPITPLVVEGRICVEIQAIYDDITARAIRTMQTHLRLTGCEIGLIACFGKTKFMIRGVRR